MEVRQIHGLCYSATGVTEKVVRALMGGMEEELGLSQAVFHGFRKPDERAVDYIFAPGDLVIVGSPTYAGRMPNKIVPDFQKRLQGNGALAVAAVTFGNRAFDDALAELCALLEENGFHTVAAGAFPGRHAFTDVLGEGRPNWDDKRAIRDFAGQIAKKVGELEEVPSPVKVPGDPSAPYYVPKGLDGETVKFLKAKPQTDLSKCCNCGVCARTCPMGSINPENVAEVPGICIKCQSCVRKCTHHAKYFDDPAFLSHVAMLEKSFQEPKECAVFL
ncbi:MAG: ferredoxin [Oscillibacter sp.]|nr:ferredoxin [Oscillibacter sp.]